MAARLPGTFYVDDPQDGASLYLLNSLGVTLLRGGAAAAAAREELVATPHAQALTHEHALS